MFELAHEKAKGIRRHSRTNTGRQGRERGEAASAWIWRSTLLSCRDFHRGIPLSRDVYTLKIWLYSRDSVGTWPQGPTRHSLSHSLYSILCRGATRGDKFLAQQPKGAYSPSPASNKCLVSWPTCATCLWWRSALWKKFHELVNH